MRVLWNCQIGQASHHLPHVCSQSCNAMATQINLRDMPSEAEVKLVEREIRLHSELDHPHIIKLWDTILEGDSIYMVMEYA
jgi:serine/threonine protein kinase